MYFQAVSTHNEVSLVVVNMDLSIGHPKQQDLTVWRPGHMCQLGSLQFFTPDPVPCEKKKMLLHENLKLYNKTTNIYILMALLLFKKIIII